MVQRVAAGLIPALIIMLTTCPALGAQERAREISETLIAFGQALSAEGWKTATEDGSLRAYRYQREYEEMLVSISRKDLPDFHVYQVIVLINGDRRSREFRVMRDAAARQASPSSLIMPFLLESVHAGPSASARQVYFTRAGAGYNRFNDNARFYPECQKGSVYASFSLLYYPSINTTEKSIPLSVGDYFSLAAWLAFDTTVRENYYNITLLLTGRQKYERDAGKEKRSLSGLFTGVEFFRPTAGYASFTWDQPVYEEHPHIQYIIFRALEWGLIKSSGDLDRWTMSLSAALGPSINSSLNATDIPPEGDDDLSFIFKSKEYGDRKQNFYYSISLSASFSLAYERASLYRVESGYKFYFFTPVEDETAYDILNIVRFSPGLFLRDDLILNVTYEFWYLHSLLQSSVKTHFWNRMLIAVEFIL